MPGDTLALILPFVLLPALPFAGLLVWLVTDYWRWFRKSGIQEQTGRGYWHTITDVGSKGEYLTYKELAQLPGEKHFIFNCYVPTAKGSTEIDLLMIHETGLYVVESKNYSGWIFGNDRDRQWTQSLPGGKKMLFDNPVRQNAGHISALKSFLLHSGRELAADGLGVFSVIVFSNRCTLKKVSVKGCDILVLHRHQLRTLFNHRVTSGKLISPAEQEQLYQQLLPLCESNQAVKDQHIQRLQEI